ncbi:hypothetical protein HPP92_016838 [Vanilla planifolia]|uniref:Uncharacterized protein n=1 Tax=Vanilla planifolia TaxID=51239 RepID=A0A835UQG7_VANPL|nr:hypothetical protein HPP92_016838 [Vanilla planifolia]
MRNQTGTSEPLASANENEDSSVGNLSDASCIPPIFQWMATVLGYPDWVRCSETAGSTGCQSPTPAALTTAPLAINEPQRANGSRSPLPLSSVCRRSLLPGILHGSCTGDHVFGCRHSNF